MSRRILAALASAACAAVSLAVPAYADNVVTPGNFTGYGFDQCLAPSGEKMATWMESSPYSAVGIYISGDSRACRSQPNLTPDWITNQLKAGWRLLPITLGPQASCTTRPRYLQQVRINPSPINSYAAAAAQGRAEADKAVAAASALTIAEGSTLWYDIEAFDIRGRDCRESALTFLSAWTEQLHKRGWVSGIYSSAASGIKMLDDARALRPGVYEMPDQLWIADWNGKADVFSSYIRSDGWMPRSRVHQYRGGHNETWGGVTINIDNNWLDLGRGSVAGTEAVHCGGVSYNLPAWTPLAPGSTAYKQISALQCMLKSRGLFNRTITGVYGRATIAAVRAYQTRKNLPVQNNWTQQAWTVLLAEGVNPVVKVGSAGPAVRRLQRALTAAGAGNLEVTGVMNDPTKTAVMTFQTRAKLSASGIANTLTWKALMTGLPMALRARTR